MGELLVIAFIFGIIGAVVAQNRSGEAFGGFLISFFLGPIGILIAAIKKPDPKRLDKLSERQGLRKCEHCAEWVRPEAKVCKHCGRDIQPAAWRETRG